MGRDQETVFGLLNIHKPSGPTSHDIVAAVRRGANIRRVGHAGTLDPLAEGVLVLALGQATRLMEYMVASKKVYNASIRLGIVTDSYDSQGAILEENPIPESLTREDVEAALQEFSGEIEQVPPVYSAIKVKGKPAYARVRAGETVILDPRQVTIYNIELKEFSPPHLSLSITCSPGTYIRSIIHDLGQVLGCGAIMDGLVREAVGDFTVENAISLDKLQSAFDDGSWQDHLIPAERVLEDKPQVILDAESIEDIRNGRAIASSDVVEGVGCACLPDGRLVAVLSGDPANQVWRPKKVFTSRLP